MYYEEKVIGGFLCYRTNPNDDGWMMLDGPKAKAFYAMAECTPEERSQVIRHLEGC